MSEAPKFWFGMQTHREEFYFTLGLCSGTGVALVLAILVAIFP